MEENKSYIQKIRERKREVGKNQKEKENGRKRGGKVTKGLG